MKSAMVRQLYLLSIFFLISIAIAYFLVNKVSQPLNKLTEYSKKLASYDFSSAVDIRSDDEIGLLADTMKSEQGFVTCRVKRTGGDIMVSMIDTGIGIAEADKEKVFEKFNQAGDTLKKGRN